MLTFYIYAKFCDILEWNKKLVKFHISRNSNSKFLMTSLKIVIKYVYVGRDEERTPRESYKHDVQGLQYSRCSLKVKVKVKVKI